MVWEKLPLYSKSAGNGKCTTCLKKSRQPPLNNYYPEGPPQSHGEHQVESQPFALVW